MTAEQTNMQRMGFQGNPYNQQQIPNLCHINKYR
eukprot:UN20389